MEVNLELSIASIDEIIELIIKLEYFGNFGNLSSEVQSDVWGDQRSRDNESWDSKISKNKHGRSLIYGVREQRISQGYWECKREHSKAMYT